MTTLVLGGTGTVGSALVPRLATAGQPVRVLTRDPARTQRFEGVETVVGDLLDPYEARAHFAGVERVFMLNAAHLGEVQEGLTAIYLARQAGVRRFVYMSTHCAHLTPFMPVGGGTKLAIEQAVMASGMTYTILRPNSFLQNDIWYLDGMRQHGVYAQPIGSRGMSRVDVRDIADVAALALLEDALADDCLSVVGEEVHTGDSVAATWSAALGTKVAYVGDDLGLYEQNHRFNTAYLRFDYGLFFEFYQRHGLVATSEELDRQRAVLGRPARRLEDFAAETLGATPEPAQASQLLSSQSHVPSGG